MIRVLSKFDLIDFNEEKKCWKFFEICLVNFDEKHVDQKKKRSGLFWNR